MNVGEIFTTTNVDGVFAFSNVPDGVYVLTAERPVGYLFANVSSVTQQIIVSNGQVTSSDGSLIELGMTAGSQARIISVRYGRRPQHRCQVP